MVLKLIELGADVNKACHKTTYINNVGSFLHLAVLKANANASIIKLLLEHGAKRHWAAQASVIRIPCTLALQQGTINTFLEAVDGKLNPCELLELLCINYKTKNRGSPEALLIEDLVANNKIRMNIEVQARSNFEELQTEKHALLSPQYLDFMKKFPTIEAWRLFVDGSKQQWYALALMSEIIAADPNPGVLYLSEDGRNYLISMSKSENTILGSLVDLSDLESGQERVDSLKAAFED